MAGALVQLHVVFCWTCSSPLRRLPYVDRLSATTNAMFLVADHMCAAANSVLDGVREELLGLRQRHSVLQNAGDCDTVVVYRRNHGGCSDFFLRRTAACCHGPCCRDSPAVFGPCIRKAHVGDQVSLCNRGTNPTLFLIVAYFSFLQRMRVWIGMQFFSHCRCFGDLHPRTAFDGAPRCAHCSCVWRRRRRGFLLGLMFASGLGVYLRRCHPSIGVQHLCHLYVKCLG